MSDQPDAQPIKWGSKTPPLNIREAEEWASLGVSEKDLVAAPRSVIKAVQGIAALYWEAVEALEKIAGNRQPSCGYQCADIASAVLAKAREALGVDHSKPHGPCSVCGDREGK